MYLELRAYGIAKKFGKVTYLGKKVPKARAISVVQGPYSLEPNSGTLLMADSLVAICNYGVSLGPPHLLDLYTPSFLTHTDFSDQETVKGYICDEQNLRTACVMKWQ